VGYILSFTSRYNSRTPLMNGKISLIVGLKEIVKFSKRYFITTLFPVICFGAIYKDYNQTLKYKAKNSKEGTSENLTSYIEPK